MYFFSFVPLPFIICLHLSMFLVGFYFTTLGCVVFLSQNFPFLLSHLKFLFLFWFFTIFLFRCFCFCKFFLKNCRENFHYFCIHNKLQLQNINTHTHTHTEPLKYTHIGKFAHPHTHTHTRINLCQHNFFMVERKVGEKSLEWGNFCL